MNWTAAVSEVFVQAICFIIVIMIGHKIYEYIKNSFSKRVVKDMYYTQVEKYKDIVTELQKEEEESMENELNHFLEESIAIV